MMNEVDKALAKKLKGQLAGGKPNSVERETAIKAARTILWVSQTKARLAYVEDRHEQERHDVVMALIMATDDRGLVRCTLTATEAVQLVQLVTAQLGGLLEP